MTPERETERERVAPPVAILAQVDLPLSPCGGALEDGPLRLLAVPSNLGGWTLLQAEEGLSLIPAAALLQRPCRGKVRVQ